MSAALIKGKLKAARDAIAKKDFKSARDASEQILSFDPSNYNGNVFLGLSLLELGENDKAEEAYRSAISLSPEQPLAWQGLAKFYERTDRLDKLAETLVQLMELFRKADDAIKCAETLQKLIELRRTSGSKVELSTSLKLLLPGSPFYDVLSSLPAPDPTAPTSTTTLPIQEAIYNSLPILQELVSIEEKQEEDFIRGEVEKRRLRLNAPPLPILKQDVRREVFSTSKAPELYQEIVNHPNTSDDLRRATESKLFRYKLDHLFTLSSSEETAKKGQLRKDVEDMINGVVLLKIPDELAWSLYIDGLDSSELDAYDPETFRQFLRLFPHHPLCHTIQGILLYLGYNLREKEEDDVPEDHGHVSDPQTDPVDLILRGFDEAKESILSHRVTSQVYLDDKDYENAIQVAEAGLSLVKRNEANFGRPLNQIGKAFNIIIATSLVHLHPPKHHLKALGLLQKLLLDEPNNVPSLMARGYILEYADKWNEAMDVFDKVTKLVGMDDVGVGLEAREEKAWCRIHEEGPQREIGNGELNEVIKVLETLDGRQEEKARAMWRVGWSLWKTGGDHRGESYQYFISSLKSSSAFAPAFTSLGIYYLEQASPPDHVRASKCFQKAFELDAREGDAARRLAEGFAEDREWDLVEVVARRTIEGEGGVEGGLAGIVGDATGNKRYLPTNAWAWKALGVVELNKSNFAEAVQAFQITLRADDADFQSWLRLGEAYAKSGRHVASLKALERAKDLAPPDDWTCHYVTGDVLRQLQHYDEAITSFERIVEIIGEEPGVLVAIAQTCLENGRIQRSTGFHARAEDSFLRCISAGMKVVSGFTGFKNLGWKATGDGLWELGARTQLADETAAKATLLHVVQSLRVAGADASPKVLDGPGTLPSLDFIVEHLHNDDASGRWAIALAAAVAQFLLEKSKSENGVENTAYAFDLAITSTKLVRLGISDILVSEDPDSTKKQEWEEAIQRKAVVLTQSSIKADPRNVTYWNALGALCVERDLKLAQHAYIRAIEIDPKNPGTWTNLGLLYLIHSDNELATEAFSKAQTLNPDFVLAWVGQALIAESQGHYKEATAIFEHAVSISPDVPEADLEFATRVFQQFSGIKAKLTHPDVFFTPFSALDRFVQQRPLDSTALHLFGLICEKLGQNDLAAELLSRCIAVLDVIYNEREDKEIERRYATAQINLGRVKVALGHWAEGRDALEAGLSLLPEEGQGQREVICAKIGLGMAYWKIENLERAVEVLEDALSGVGQQDGDLKGDVGLVLAQILWSIGTDETKEAAKTQLFDVITENPQNMEAVSGLAAIGILDSDDDLVDAALSELLGLPLNERHELDPIRAVEKLLVRRCLSKGDVKEAAGTLASAVHVEPGSALLRMELAKMLIQRGDVIGAQSVINGLTELNEAQRHDLAPSLRLLATASTLISKSEGERRMAVQRAQRATMMNPWDASSWKTLEYCLSMSK